MDLSNCEVYNPATKIYLTEFARVSKLPAEMRNYVEDKVGEALLNMNVADDKFDDEYDRAMASRIVDLQEMLSVTEVMDQLAIMSSFDPRRVAVREAAWVVRDEQGKQYLCHAELMADVDSINGHCWDARVYAFDDHRREWACVFQETAFKVQDATDILDKIEKSYAKGRIDWDNAKVTRIENYMYWGAGFEEWHVRKLTDHEIDSCENIDWVREDAPRFPSRNQFKDILDDRGEFVERTAVFGKYDAFYREEPMRWEGDGIEAGRIGKLEIWDHGANTLVNSTTGISSINASPDEDAFSRCLNILETDESGLWRSKRASQDVGKPVQRAEKKPLRVEAPAARTHAGSPAQSQKKFSEQARAMGGAARHVPQGRVK